jgi:hypothetical protein
MESTEKGYKGRNIYILSDSQAAIKALNVKINSKLVWDCHQSLVRLAEHNRIQLLWVPGHIGIEVADQLARIARQMIRGWTNRKHAEYWQYISGQKQAKGFLKRLSAKRARELFILSRNQLTVMTGLLTGHCYLKGHLFKRAGKRSLA